MINYLLFFCCLILFAVILQNSKYQLTSPKVLLTSGFMVSTLVFAIATSIWHYEISVATLFYIVISIIVFLSGCHIGFKTKVKRIHEINNDIEIGYVSFFIFMLIILVGIYVRYLVIIELVGRIGEGDLAGLRGEDVTSSYDTYLKFLTPSISAICIYAIAYLFSEYRKGTKRYLKSIFIILGYFIYCALSSARIEVIYLFVYLFVFYSILINKDKKPKITPKIMAYMAVFTALGVLAFYGLGYLTGKSQNQESVFENVAIYTASGIGALDVYLTEFNYSINNIFTSSFKGVYIFLSYFGLPFNSSSWTDPNEMNMIMYGDMNHNTNVYTFLRPLVHDYNYIGSLVFVFFEGWLYTLIYKRAINSSSVRNLWLFLYVYSCPFIFMSSISERFCNVFISVTTLAFILFIKFSNKVFIKDS